MSAARAFVRFSTKVTRSSFGVTDGTFLLLILYLLCVDKEEKNKQAAWKNQLLVGTVKINLLPCPKVLSTLIVPPFRETKLPHNTSPKPDPFS